MKIHSDLQNGIERIREWDACLARSFLQDQGFFEPLLRKILQVAKDEANADPQECLDRGFNNVHKFMTARQIKLLAICLAREQGPASLRTITSRLTKQIAEDELGVKERFWIDYQPVVRFYTPHDFWAVNKEHLNVGGHLRIQGPHQDTWFGHSKEGLNLWMAIGRVRKGNGLSLFPEAMEHVPLKHDGKYRMLKNQRLGRPVNFDMEPGDLLFFHGELVHSSELNVTDETRFVITTRFSLTPPEFADKPHGGTSPWITSDQA